MTCSPAKDVADSLQVTLRLQSARLYYYTIILYIYNPYEVHCEKCLMPCSPGEDVADSLQVPLRVQPARLVPYLAGHAEDSTRRVHRHDVCLEPVEERMHKSYC